MNKRMNFPLKSLLAAGLAVALTGCSERSEQPAETELAAADEPIAGAVEGRWRRTKEKDMAFHIFAYLSFLGKGGQNLK